MICTCKNTLKYLGTLKDFDTPESVIKFYAKPTTKRLAKLCDSDSRTEGDRASYSVIYFLCNILEV